MYAIISSQTMDEVYSAYGAPAFHDQGADLRNALVMAARLNLDHLIIDLDIANGQAILEALHNFRIQRASTRIIILARGRKPGDPGLAGIAERGIYDIVTPEEHESSGACIATALSSEPATYAQAARWLIKTPSFNNRDKTSVSETIIQHRSFGLIVIAVAAAGSGAGASHLSLAIAAHIARNRHRAVLVEFPAAAEEGAGEAPQYSLYSKYPGAKTETGIIQGINIELIRLQGFDILAESRTYRGIEWIFPFVSQNYEYMILDLGDLTPEKVTEMDRATLAILATNATPHRINKFHYLLSNNSLNYIAPNLNAWTIALNLADEKQEKWFKSQFAACVGSIVAVPFIPEPLAKESIDMGQGLLGPVMPAYVVAQKKESFWKRKLRGWINENRD